jgi:hypothetical protein
MYVWPNLRLFDEGAAVAAGESGANAVADTGEAKPVEDKKAKPEKNPLAKVVYGKQPETDSSKSAGEGKGTDNGADAAPNKTAETLVTADTAEARKAKFEELISGEYKDLYGERVQQQINARFKSTKTLESQVAALNPVLDLLASRYGVDAKDVDALSKAVAEDDAWLEQEAMEMGLTKEQAQEYKRLERENESFRAAEAERAQQEHANRILSEWHQQAEQMKPVYPKFDLKTECSHPETGQRFTDLLAKGVDVKTAFEVIHKDELIGGAMQYTAQQVEQKVTNNIRVRGMRPVENGSSGNAASTIIKSDPSTWTKEDREEVSRRVRMGERIEL